MTNPITGANLSGLGLGVPQGDKKEDLGQEQFLQLMVTQLKNQDPFKPMESGEFLGQLAQFGTVSGLAGLQTSFDSLAGSLVSNQALQAAGLVGRSALVESASATVGAGEGISGAIDLPASSGAVRLFVKDDKGQVVREIDLGARSAGLVPFSWDGVTDAGTPAAAGSYTLAAEFHAGNKSEAADTLVNSSVDSVRFGADGFSVQVRGIGEVPFGAVREIRNDFASITAAATAAAATN